MKWSLAVLGVIAATACASRNEVPPVQAAFLTDDCTLLAAIGRDQFGLSRDDPAVRVELEGEDAPWRPGCDWQAFGFNVVETAAADGAPPADDLGEITFHRPRYDSQGALVRTTVAANGVIGERLLCRVTRNASVWSVESCGPDPKETQPRPAPPSPTDATPDNSRTLPSDIQPSARDLNNPDADPGAPLGGPN